MPGVSEIAADAVIECLERFETLDAFLAWARGGVVTAAQPMPEAGDQALYVTPRPAVMEIDASLLGNCETRRQAWDELNAHPGRTLEGALETMRRAAEAAPNHTVLRRTATKKWTAHDSASISRTNRHVSFECRAFLGPVPTAVRTAMESPVVQEWLKVGEGRVQAKQLHLYYGEFRHLATHCDLVPEGGSQIANLLLQLGGPSVMRLGDTKVQRTVGSVLCLSGAARGSVRHGLEGDRARGSMSVIYAAPNERMAEASIVLSVVGTLASAIVLHHDQDVRGSESDAWTPHRALQLYEALENYKHPVFGAVDHRELGQRGGLAAQRKTDPDRLREIRSAGGRAGGLVTARRKVETGEWARVCVLGRQAAAIAHVKRKKQAQRESGYTALRGLLDAQWDELERRTPALRKVRERMGWDRAQRRWVFDEDKCWQKFKAGMNDDRNRAQLRSSAQERLDAVELAVKYALT